MKPDIFLVEDSDTDAAIIERIFNEQGFRVQVFTDGISALKCIRDPEFLLPRLFLIDLRLPGVSGMELIEFLRTHSKTRGIPVVAMTSSAELKDVTACYKLGVNDFIQKPIEFDAFQARIASIDLNRLGVSPDIGSMIPIG